MSKLKRNFKIANKMYFRGQYIAPLVVPWRNYTMERPRGMNCVKTGGGRTLCTVHYIKQKNCTARFATGAI